MSSDALHDAKMYFNAPTIGMSERLEVVGKSIAPAFGLEGFSTTLQRLARNFAALLEYYKLATVLRHKDISFADGMSKHMFFVDDKIVNAAILLGCGIAIISQPSLLLPLVLIAVAYFASDKFLKTVEKL